jgi:hypothetical protein
MKQIRDARDYLDVQIKQGSLLKQNITISLNDDARNQ